MLFNFMNMTDILQLNIHFRHFDYIPFYAIVENTALFYGRTCAKVFFQSMLLRMAVSKKERTSLGRMWRNGTFVCGQWERKIVQQFWKNSMAVSQKSKNYHMIQQFCFWVYTQKNLKQAFKQIFVHQHSQQHSSQQQKEGNSSDVHCQMNG